MARGYRGPLEGELAVAARLAREAGAAIEAVRRDGFEALTKADTTPVTAADLAADRVITDGLAAAYPDDRVLSEESGFAPGAFTSCARAWVVDPLDGTEAFVDGTIRGYAVQIGLLVAGRPALGVVYEPRADRLWWAVRDAGAFEERDGARGGPLAVSARGAADARPLVTSTTIDRARRRRLLDLGLIDGGELRSVGVKVGELVSGAADVYVIHHPVSYWDTCAPLVVLEESGGALTDLLGRPLAFDLEAPSPTHPGPLVASNNRDHAALCARVRAVWEG